MAVIGEVMAGLNELAESKKRKDKINHYQLIWAKSTPFDKMRKYHFTNKRRVFSKPYDPIYPKNVKGQGITSKILLIDILFRHFINTEMFIDFETTDIEKAKSVIEKVMPKLIKVFGKHTEIKTAEEGNKFRLHITNIDYGDSMIATANVYYIVNSVLLDLGHLIKKR